MINFNLDLNSLMKATKYEIEELKRKNKVDALRKLASELQSILNEFEVMPNDNIIYTLMIKNNNIIGIDRTE